MSKTIRLKVKHGLKGFVPESFNFSHNTIKRAKDNGVSLESYDDLSGSYGDDGEEMIKVQEGVDYEKLVLQVLFSLDATEKIIFLCQLMRDNGYQIDHGSFAKTLQINRVKYMNILKMVRIKTLLIVRGKSLLESTHKTNE